MAVQNKADVMDAITNAESPPIKEKQTPTKTDRPPKAMAVSDADPFLPSPDTVTSNFSRDVGLLASGPYFRSGSGCSSGADRSAIGSLSASSRSRSCRTPHSKLSAQSIYCNRRILSGRTHGLRMTGMTVFPSSRAKLTSSNTFADSTAAGDSRSTTCVQPRSASSMATSHSAAGGISK